MQVFVFLQLCFLSINNAFSTTFPLFQKCGSLTYWCYKSQRTCGRGELPVHIIQHSRAQAFSVVMGWGGASGETQKILLSCIQDVSSDGKVPFFSQPLSVCVYREYGEKASAQRGERDFVHSRFNKLVNFSPLVVSQKQPLQYWWCLNVGTSTLCRGSSYYGFLYFIFLVHSTHDCLASPSASHCAVSGGIIEIFLPWKIFFLICIATVFVYFKMCK